jgi:hypothetical protein
VSNLEAGSSECCYEVSLCLYDGPSQVGTIDDFEDVLVTISGARVETPVLLALSG